MTRAVWMPLGGRCPPPSLLRPRDDASPRHGSRLNSSFARCGRRLTPVRQGARACPSTSCASEASALARRVHDYPVGADDGLNVSKLARRPPGPRGPDLRGAVHPLARSPSISSADNGHSALERRYGHRRQAPTGPQRSRASKRRPRGLQGRTAGAASRPLWASCRERTGGCPPSARDCSSGGGRMAPAARCQARPPLVADEFVVSGLKVKYPAGAALRRPVLVVLVLG